MTLQRTTSVAVIPQQVGCEGDLERLCPIIFEEGIGISWRSLSGRFERCCFCDRVSMASRLSGLSKLPVLSTRVGLLSGSSAGALISLPGLAKSGLSALAASTTVVAISVPEDDLSSVALASSCWFCWLPLPYRGSGIKPSSSSDE
jgi:hypothetical protein